VSNWPNNSYRPARKSTIEAVAAKDEDAVYNTLTTRQRRFAEEYVIDYNGQAAAIRAGYSTKHPDKQATALLKNEGIAFLIDCLTRSKTAKIVSVDPDYIIQQVLQIISEPRSQEHRPPSGT
jgi:phage terminase small subunit